MHVKLSEEEQVRRLLDVGMPEHFAKFVTSLEVKSSKGMEERTSDAVEKVTGRPPQTFDAWVQYNKTAWQ